MNMEPRRTPARKPKETLKLPTSATTEDQVEVVHGAQAEAADRALPRQSMIAAAAYFRAEKRGFEPGHELDDWLAAEVEVANARQLPSVAW